jgi:hypothetical protein
MSLNRGLFPTQDEPEGEGMLRIDDQRARSREAKSGTDREVPFGHGGSTVRGQQTGGGMMEFMKSGPPIHNILNTAHELLVQSILIHRRHFAEDSAPTPMMRAAVKDFVDTWVFAETSFDRMLHEYRPGVFYR